MNSALVLSALLMGLAASPHCAVMCGAPCAALCSSRGGGAAQPAWHLSRLLGYSVAGAVLGGTAMAIGAWVNSVPALSTGLRGLWVALHATALGLGLWWLLRGREPAFWTALLARAVAPSTAASPSPPVPTPVLKPMLKPMLWRGEHRLAATAPGVPRVAPPTGELVTGAGAGLRLAVPWRAATAGAFWWAMPCGLLHAALLVAALSGQAMGGALVMAAFALGSAPGLLLAPAVLQRLRLGPSLALRVAGGLLVLAALWALWHDALGGGIGSLCLPGL
jgi:sulfite exporter TauE/SafE